MAACARPTIAGDKASQTAVAFDDFRNARRLTDTVFISFPPRAFYHAATLIVDRKCMTKWKPVARQDRKCRAITRHPPSLRVRNRRARAAAAGWLRWSVLPARCAPAPARKRGWRRRA